MPNRQSDKLRLPKAAKAFQSIRYPAVPGELRQWECYLTSVGRQCYQPGEPYPRKGEHPTSHDFRWERGRRLQDFALIWIEDGCGQLELRTGSRTELRPGNCLLLAPGTWHRYRPRRNEGWIESWLCLDGAYPHRMHGKALLPDVAILPRVPGRDWQARFHSLIRQVAGDRHGAPFAWAAYGLALMQEAAGALGSHRGISLHPASGDERIDSVLRWLDEHCHLAIRVDGLARRFAISPRTLERRMNRVCGIGVRRALMEARVRRAEALLADPVLSIKQVAYSCGYSDHRRLNENFHVVHGQSPSDWRRSPYHSGLAPTG